MSKAMETPTKAEIEILQILWKKKSATVREVHESMERRTGYTTVLKLMQIMTVKRFVSREEHGKAHVYRPEVSQMQTTGNFLRDLMDRVFSGSAPDLVMQALHARKTTREELQKIRKLLDDMEGGKP
jgi:predicted transcriptional regulator